MKALPVRVIPVGIFSAVVVAFCCNYTRYYEGAALVTLLVFFAYFYDLLSARRSIYALPSQGPSQILRSPLRELVKALASLVCAGAVAALASYSVSDTGLAVSIALTSVWVGSVGFLLFVLNAVRAWVSGRK